MTQTLRVTQALRSPGADAPVSGPFLRGRVPRRELFERLERILHELEKAGGCVTSLDARRSWFRYSALLSDLLQFELRRSCPREVRGLHVAAARWWGDRDSPIEAVRHAQAAEDWRLATRLLADHWIPLSLSGRGATAHALLAAFPAAVVTTDPELAAIAAADQWSRGSLDECERYLALAMRGAASVPADRRGRFEIQLTLLRLSVASRRGDLSAVVDDAERLLAPIEAAETARLAPETRALALFGLGHAELSTSRLDEAEHRASRDSGAAQSLREPLSESEMRVLRYLPTNLSAPEIANELYLAVATVKTHLRHIYAKLGVHRRAEAVERARGLGLLAPSALKPNGAR